MESHSCTLRSVPHAYTIRDLPIAPRPAVSPSPFLPKESRSCPLARFLTQGVIKNIIPAIASTNAIVAAACASEAFKIVTNCAAYLDNNLMYMGGRGLYAPTFKYERNPSCVICGEGVALSLSPKMSLTLLMEAMAEDPRLRLKAPSIRVHGGKRGDSIYMRGVLEEHYSSHLDLPISELFDSGATLHVTDPSVPSAMKVLIEFDGKPDVDLS